MKVKNKVFKDGVEHREVWGFSDYLASADGYIWSKRTGQYLSDAIDACGYRRCVLAVNGKMHTKKVHRLILMAFNYIDGCEGLQVNHINFDKADNRIENLEWVTALGNARHSINGNKFYCNAGWNRIELPQEIIGLLGCEPDYKLAEKAGCTKGVIARERKERRIKPYSEQTGNNGRFKKR